VRDIYFSFYHVLIFICIFQGFLLAYIFLFNKNFRKKSSVALSIGLIALSIAGVWEIIQDLELHKQYNILNYLPISNLSVAGISFYYFVVFLLTPKYKFSQKDYLFLLPFTFIFLLKIFYYSIHLVYPVYLETHQQTRNILSIITNYLPILYLAWIIQSLLKKINLYHQNLFDNFSDTEGKDLYWLRNFIYILIALTVIWFSIISLMFFYQTRIWPFYFMWIAVSLIIIWLAYFVILRRDVFAIPVFKEKKPLQNEKATLSDKTEEHYQKLLTLLQQEKLYQDAQLNMDTLAEKTDLSNGYLSKIINQKEGKNFYDFINSYRITEVKNRLSHPDFAHYSILGIALEAGFKSKSTFNAVFKKMTGMTPSVYKKSLS